MREIFKRLGYCLFPSEKEAFCNFILFPILNSVDTVSRKVQYIFNFYYFSLSKLHLSVNEVWSSLFFFKFFICLFTCAYTVWGISPLCPHPHPLSHLASRQHLSSPCLWLCWIKGNPCHLGCPVLHCLESVCNCSSQSTSARAGACYRHCLWPGTVMAPFFPRDGTLALIRCLVIVHSRKKGTSESSLVFAIMGTPLSFAPD
jgi:hypothetical protein